MTDVSFYHLQRDGLHVALPKLLERALEAGKRAVVRVAGEDAVGALDEALWTYRADSFLPHGTAKLGHTEMQPVYLTVEDDNPNGADVLVLTDGVMSDDIEGYERCLYMFDGRLEEATVLAREHWKSFKEAGHSTTYWQQTDRGGWEKKM